MADRESETIRAVLRGDVDRYAELVNAYQGPAMRLAASLLGNHEDAKDASQDAFVKAYQGLRHFRGGAKFSTWLYRIVVNTCQDVFRRRARAPVVVTRAGEAGTQEEGDAPPLFEKVEDPTGDPAHRLAQQELAQRISQAIGRLPMTQRTAFVLHHVEGLRLEEVAEVLRCRLGTAKSHLFRATEHLRRELGPWVAKEGV